jgi:hypothetical protein
MRSGDGDERRHVRRIDGDDNDSGMWKCYCGCEATMMMGVGL